MRNLAFWVARTTCCPGARSAQEAAGDLSHLLTVFCSPSFVVPAGFVPEGQPKIARQFIAGFISRKASRPGGTLERVASPISGVPMGRLKSFADDPAINCRAIFERPSGTTEGRSAKFHFALTLPTPSGWEALSPGLAQQRLPWVNPKRQPNPVRVESTLFDDASTPTGLVRVARLPRVGPSVQPWAECLQPLQGCRSRRVA